MAFEEYIVPPPKCTTHDVSSCVESAEAAEFDTRAQNGLKHLSAFTADARSAAHTCTVHSNRNLGTTFGDTCQHMFQRVEGGSEGHGLGAGGRTGYEVLRVRSCSSCAGMCATEAA